MNTFGTIFALATDFSTTLVSVVLLVQAATRALRTLRIRAAPFACVCCALRESSGLSAVDSAIVMWAVAQSNPTLTPPGLDFAQAPAVKSRCLAADAAELARVGITLPTPIEPEPETPPAAPRVQARSA